MVAANYSHWDTLSDKDSVSLQVSGCPKIYWHIKTTFPSGVFFFIFLHGSSELCDLHHFKVTFIIIIVHCAGPVCSSKSGGENT